MKNYKELADYFQANVVDKILYSEKDFKAKMKARGLKFIQKIDDKKGYSREVYGSKNFEIVVLHYANNNYQFLS